MGLIELLEFKPVTTLGRSFDANQVSEDGHLINLEYADHHSKVHVPTLPGALYLGYSVSQARRLGHTHARLPLISLGLQSTPHAHWGGQLFLILPAIEAMFGTDQASRYADLRTFGVPDAWATLLSPMPMGPEVPLALSLRLEIAQVPQLLKWMALSGSYYQEFVIGEDTDSSDDDEDYDDDESEDEDEWHSDDDDDEEDDESSDDDPEEDPE